MKATPQEEKILRKEIYATLRSLRSDIKIIKGLSQDNPLIPTDAIDKMKKINRQLRKQSVKRTETKDLISLNRQLKYIRNLKSSTPEGATKTAETFQTIRNEISKMSEEERKKWFSAYSELYEKSRTFEKFKYEVFDLTDKLYGKMEAEDIFDLVLNARTQAEIELREESDIYNEGRLRILFSEKLKQFL